MRRGLREIKRNSLRYGAVFLLVAAGLVAVMALMTSSSAVIETVEDFRSSSRLEDGNFETRAALTSSQQASITRHDVRLQDQPWVDVTGPEDSAVRLQGVRATINTIRLSDGRLPKGNGEVVLEKLYAAAHHLDPGDEVKLAGKQFTVSGLGSTPDYSYVVPSVASSSTSPVDFGTAFVTAKQFEAVATGKLTPSHTYAYLLPDDVTHDQLRSWLNDMTVDPHEVSNPALRSRVADHQAANCKTATIKLPVLNGFQTADTNPRVITVTNDAEVNQTTALFAGLLLLVLVAYMLTAFAIDNLEQDSASIGALSAMGLRRRELVLQYLTPPLMVVVLACIVGTLGGGLGAKAFNDFAQLTAGYSVPDPKPHTSIIALAVGLLAAPILVAVVVAVQLQRKLSQSPLSLLRKTPNQKVGGKGLSFEGWPFRPRFRIRQALRESRSYLTMLAGLLLAVVLMVFGFGMQSSISSYSDHVTKDLAFNYMYILQVPNDEAPSGTEAALATGVAVDGESQSDVTLLGLPEKSKYFDFDLHRGADTGVAVSEAVASRYGLEVGDLLFLTDQVSARSYRVTVSQVVSYAPGLYIFQPINANRSLLGEENDYYNAVISDHAVAFKEGQVSTTVTRKDIVNGAERTVKMTSPIVGTLVLLSVAIFCIVLALLIRMIVDRDTYSISLMKSFGYREGEVARLYLDNYALVALLALVLGIPLGLVVLTPVWRTIIASMPMGAAFQLDPRSMATIVGIVVVAYLLVYLGSRVKLSRVEATEILKDRE